MKKRYLVALLLMLSVVSIFIGAKDISIKNIFNLSEENLNIIILSRLPRLISIIFAGVSMSIAGLIMQQITQNKFVSPTTAGTINFAKLGILFSLIFFTSASSLNKMLLAFLFSVGGTFLFMFILRHIKVKNTVFIPLIGMMLGGVIDSITTAIAYRFDLVQSIGTWLQGDFSMIIKGRYEMLYISIPLLIIAVIYANKFTLAGIGEDFSINLGLNYKFVVNLGITIVALISAIVIVTVGRIPFLGLIVPNIVSLIKGDNMKNSIGYTALIGANFLLISDIVGRVIIYPYEVSISLTVGVFGSIIFLYLLIRGNQ
ncbi:ABC transporter permease [Senegalia massiliensis]|uniref:ABC transporter permease n=1 Tax=Senegalia massiliensis TaxID=1720316 RepID=A0A845QZE4_9CLOT|nr:ABC transporter permease [Senegalia massiliensis]NBI07681.1 ABC transporter permease [Senegalia massiliensis]